ncbi:hypothetical protein EYC84_009223 [Monilinia fructicola]|uniref:Uncharacterized protein n=1 Tax=Monilinia fructicola TaxID=38448 RepID=A0A5M9JDJ2_MONFR|nr:hypothetical protein EYC84_009223 [Monilinia fructicola]
MGTSSQAYEAGYLNLSYLSSPEPFGRYDSDAPLSDEISELDLNAPPSDAADFSAIQDHSPVPDYVDTADIEPYDAGIEPYDYANFGTSTYSRTELRESFGHCKHSRHSPRSVTTERDTVPALYSRPPTHNVSYHSTPPTPLTPATPVIAANSGGHTILSRSTCFTTSRLDQGIRIRIVPETIDDTTETWIDITGVQFRPKMKRAIPGVKVIGFADWLCLEDEWMSAYYRKVLVTESIRKFENDQRNEFHAKTLNQEVFARKQVCDLKDGSKPKHKELLYPSGDDLGINWSASQAENLKVRLSMIMRRSLDPGSQAEERNNTWLWYVWKQYGLTRGWVEPSREFGDKVRNPKDSSSLTEIMVKTTKTSQLHA